ncbi:hypothetical protein JCM11957_07160 [Caminibacter profundus]
MKQKRNLFNKTKPPYNEYKKRHKKYENLDTFIDKKTFEKLIISECVYCGFKPNGKKSWNSIDRFNSNKGYNKDNIYPCCKHCNYAKGSLEFNMFKEWISRISKHFINKRGIWNEK